MGSRKRLLLWGLIPEAAASEGLGLGWGTASSILEFSVCLSQDLWRYLWLT